MKKENAKHKSSRSQALVAVLSGDDFSSTISMTPIGLYHIVYSIGYGHSNYPTSTSIHKTQA